ncbi:MAG TPA: hypothetical protein V6C78_33650 [Crinalium sp.]|jgi:hypothetical protein
MVTTKQRSKSAGKRKPATGSAIPKGIVEQATLTLQELPEKAKESLSLKETIESMYDAIKAALAKGYSQEDIASFLTGKGVEIAPASLKYYLSRLGRQKAAGQTKRKVSRAKSQASSDETSTATEAATPSKRRSTKATAPAKTTATTPEKTPRRAAAKSKSTGAEAPVVSKPKASAKAPEAPAPKSRSASQTKTKAPAKTTTTQAAPVKPSTRARKKS